MKKHFKKVRHYKNYRNAFLALLNEQIYIEELRAEHSGSWWYHSMYTFHSRPVTAWYDDFRGTWHIG